MSAVVTSPPFASSVARPAAARRRRLAAAVFGPRVATVRNLGRMVWRANPVAVGVLGSLALIAVLLLSLATLPIAVGLSDLPATLHLDARDAGRIAVSGAVSLTASGFAVMLLVALAGAASADAVDLHLRVLGVPGWARVAGRVLLPLVLGLGTALACLSVLVLAVSRVAAMGGASRGAILAASLADLVTGLIVTALLFELVAAVVRRLAGVVAATAIAGAVVSAALVGGVLAFAQGGHTASTTASWLLAPWVSGVVAPGGAGGLGLVALAVPAAVVTLTGLLALADRDPATMSRTPTRTARALPFDLGRHGWVWREPMFVLGVLMALAATLAVAVTSWLTGRDVASTLVITLAVLPALGLERVIRLAGGFAWLHQSLGGRRAVRRLVVEGALVGFVLVTVLAAVQALVLGSSPLTAAAVALGFGACSVLTACALPGTDSIHAAVGPVLAVGLSTVLFSLAAQLGVLDAPWSAGVFTLAVCVGAVGAGAQMAARRFP